MCDWEVSAIVFRSKKIIIANKSPRNFKSESIDWINFFIHKKNLKSICIAICKIKEQYVISFNAWLSLINVKYCGKVNLLYIIA